jgi:predicted negative regulator of RcsB-dependent stress response
MEVDATKPPESAGPLGPAGSAGSEETLFKLLAWLHANQKRLLIGVAAVAVIALVAGLVSWKKSADETDADAKLFAVPAPVGSQGRSGSVSPTSLLELAQNYPGTPAGEYASLLGAETLFLNGKYPEAQQEFSKFINENPESILIPQAKMGVAASLEAQNKTSEAIQKYQELVSGYASEANISTPAKLTLARLLEEDNRPQQALAFYSELARIQNPYDPWAAEARERGELLLAKHPELKQAAQSAPAQSAPFSLQQPTIQAPLPPGGKAPAPSKPAQTTPKSGIDLMSIPGVSSNSAPK